MASCILVTRDHVEAVLPYAALSRSSWSYGIGYRVLVYVVDGDTCLLRSKRVVGISVVESHVAGHHHPPVDGPEKVVESLAFNRKMHRPKVEVATALDGQPRTDDRSSGADFVRRPRSWDPFLIEERAANAVLRKVGHASLTPGLPGEFLRPARRSWAHHHHHRPPPRLPTSRRPSVVATSTHPPATIKQSLK